MKNHYAMKTLFKLILFLSALPLGSMAQTTVCYEYDASGNRILRTTLQQQSRAKTARKAAGATAGREASPSLTAITVSPSPVHARLTVNVPGCTPSKTCELSLYDMSGRRLIYRKGSSVQTVLDVSTLHPSCYILRTVYGGEKESHKIIKE